MVGELRLTDIFCAALLDKQQCLKLTGVVTLYLTFVLWIEVFAEVREVACFDNNDSEPKSQIRLLTFPEEN